MLFRDRHPFNLLNLFIYLFLMICTRLGDFDSNVHVLRKGRQSLGEKTTWMDLRFPISDMKDGK